MERALTGLLTLTANKKSVKDLTVPFKEWPTEASAYEILDDCGRSANATVHRALCKPTGDIVAIKIMNLENMDCDLDIIIHEAQTMRQYNHPNVLPLYCSFVNGHELWIVMPFTAGGSVLHILKYGHPEGFDEVIIATVMRDVLKGLEYVHKCGGIHRDVKAGNILIDKEGAVRLGDFGVATTIDRAGDWGSDKVVRNTFVGTPCWMAPEVMEQTQGYNSAADIWSFGITLLELAHGHAPFARFPPMKVLLMTIQNPPPTLDDKGKKHFSKAMRDVVSKCLQKDPAKRPSATQLLEHKFFKQAKDDEYIAKHLLTGLPTLNERVQQIRSGKAATYVVDNCRNISLSQEEYKKGLSAWNFDLAALKAAAALEPDDDAPGSPALPTITEIEEKDGEGFSSQFAGLLDDRMLSFTTTIMSSRDSSQLEYATERPASLKESNLATASFPRSNSAFALAEDVAEVIVRCIEPDPSVVLERMTNGVHQQATGTSTPGSIHIGIDIPLSPSQSNEAGASLPEGLTGATQPSTPVAVAKQIKGRFQVYQPGSEPPLSPDIPNGNAYMLAMGGVCSIREQSGLATCDAQLFENGSKTGVLEGQLESSTNLEESTATEPQQRGRFKITSENKSGLSKPPSSNNLQESMFRKSLNRSTQLDTAGTLSALSTPCASSSAVVAVGLVMPKLQELLEQSQSHCAAVSRIMASLTETERRSSHTLPESRAESVTNLLEVGVTEDLRDELQETKGKLATAEEELARLSERVAALEAIIVSAGLTVPSQ